MDELREASTGVTWSHPGGNGLIVSSTLARLGVHTTLCAQVGDDATGELIRHFLERSRVDTSDLGVAHGIQSRRCRIRIDPNGEWQPETATPPSFPFLPDRFLHSVAGCDRFHLAGLPVMLRFAPNETTRLLHAYRDKGTPVSLSLSQFTPPERDRLLAGIAPCDFLFCALSEFRHLVGTEIAGRDDCLGALATSPFLNCVVTLGAVGAVAKWSGTQLLSAKTAAVRARNTVGAGDVLTAAFLAAWLREPDPTSALRTAVATASLAVQARAWDDWLSSDIDSELERCDVSTVADPKTLPRHG